MIQNIVILSAARWGRGFGRLNFRRADECDVVLRWLEPAAGERILDVGSGDGYYDWRISRSPAHVTGIDVHEKRLAFARRHYAATGRNSSSWTPNGPTSRPARSTGP